MFSGEGKAAQPPNFDAPPTGKWTTGLFDCFEDPGSCFSTWCCPSYTFAQNVEIIDQGRTSPTIARLIVSALGCFGCACLYTYRFRSRLRALYNLPEEPCTDFCVHYWCCIYAICQEYRELKNRGLDPSIGWKANEERMRRDNQVPPHVAPAMTR
ncbi:protein PLANT CADMIUM RESISTANCE 12-like [Abrus precatorius]|uniref:Protein PLANT CADMIUM RESISTANCE 12-like n=1 Tax=Abrus precatorius TaxID=3816 RepID=A0A8B8LX98_ABRPR|nr:protein PLANT CADMIUM RESISTANCE 12-like [Abrus precatorius]